MDWLTQLLMSLGPSSAMAQPGGGLGSDLGTGDIMSSMPPSTTPITPTPVPPSPVSPVATPAPIPQPPSPTETIGGGPSQTYGGVGPQTPGAGGEPGGGPSSLGAALEPVTQNPTQQAMKTNAIVQALRGLQAPPKPDVVKPSTPAAPQLRSIQGGDFMALLQSLSNPRQPLVGPAHAQTLGGALGIGRY